MSDNFPPNHDATHPYDRLDDEEDFGPSRTQLKREHLALENLGRELAALDKATFAKLGLNETLHAAIVEVRRLNKNAANRQFRFIRRLLADEDLEPIERILAEKKALAEKNTVQFQQLEKWRDVLATGDLSVIEAIAERYPNVDRQHLRQLTRNAKKQPENKKYARAIFKYLGDLARSA